MAKEGLAQVPPSKGAGFSRQQLLKMGIKELMKGSGANDADSEAARSRRGGRPARSITDCPDSSDDEGASQAPRIGTQPDRRADHGQPPVEQQDASRREFEPDESQPRDRCPDWSEESPRSGLSACVGVDAKGYRMFATIETAGSMMPDEVGYLATWYRPKGCFVKVMHPRAWMTVDPDTSPAAAAPAAAGAALAPPAAAASAAAAPAAAAPASRARGGPAPCEEIISQGAARLEEEIQAVNMGRVDSVLEACRDAGFQFKAKSPLCKRYERYLEANPAEYDKYNKSNRKDKGVMRSQWAEDEYNDYSKWRAKSNKYRNADRVLGRLMNLDQLIVAEGGHCSKTAVQGALETARWCIKRGAPYIKLNKRSKRMMFRHITEENDEQNTTEWKSDFEKEAKVILQEYRTCLFQGREILSEMDREDEKKGWAMMKPFSDGLDLAITAAGKIPLFDRILTEGFQEVKGQVSEQEWSQGMKDIAAFKPTVAEVYNESQRMLDLHKKGQSHPESWTTPAMWVAPNIHKYQFLILSPRCGCDTAFLAMEQLNIPTCSASWDTNSDLENFLISIHGKHSGMLNVGSEKGDFTQVDAPAFDKNRLTDKEKENLWHFMEKLEEVRPGMDDWAVACLDITRSFSGVWTPPCRFDDAIVCLTTSNHKIWLQSVSAPWISRFLLPEERASIQGLDPAMVSLLPTAGVRVTAMGNAMSLPAVGTAIAFTLQGLTGKPDVR
ncbi:unnamed protein product [Prorocentrum cordatum]|uniref:Uncharacterized protein n=1 Tax=Prorocentrum cordatum TaxID=2364126 RepID=A0ABN9SXN7_9DINO|nr:unnamed protein product [Polarella glacialis]